MKPGARALGIAESYTGAKSTLAGVVQTAEGRVDGLVFGQCSVGGTDVTESVIELYDRLDREDIHVVFIAGVALAWYNIIELDVLASRIEPPIIAITFEESDGLEDAINAAFEEEETRADRRSRYQSLPSRQMIEIASQPMFLRTTEIDHAKAMAIVEAFTPAGSTRPEPLRVAKLAARAADEVLPA